MFCSNRPTVLAVHLVRLQSTTTTLRCHTDDVWADYLTAFADLGYLGAALGTAISFWLQFLTLLCYIVFLKVHLQTLFVASLPDTGLPVVTTVAFFDTIACSA